jgi:hypothetical protein
MATIREKFDGLKPHFTAETRTYDCTYLVRGIWASSDFPPCLTWHSKGLVDPYARLLCVDNHRQLNATLSEVDAHYSTLPSESAKKRSNVEQPPNPLARPVKRRWSTGYIEQYPPADLVGKRFTVSTGEPIRGGVPIKIPYLVKHYTRNEAFFNEIACLSMIWGMDSTKQILCARFEGSEEYLDEGTGISFVEVSYEFWCLGESVTWEDKRLDAGSYWLEADGDKWKVKYLEDKDGTKAYADGAILLNKAKGKLSDEDIDAGIFHWNTFLVNHVVDFSSLGLPGV